MFHKFGKASCILFPYHIAYFLWVICGYMKTNVQTYHTGHTHTLQKIILNLGKDPGTEGGSQRGV